MTDSRCGKISIIFYGLLMSGCASTLDVTYYSDPPGAMVHANNQNLGFAPVTLTYHVSDEDLKRGYMNIGSVQARWTSGASASITNSVVNFNIGFNQRYTFKRPQDHPGQEEDIRFAFELQRLSIMQRQVEAQENAAIWQMYNSQRNRPKFVDCNSSTYGSTIHTSCY